MQMNESLPEHYGSLLGQIKERIRTAQYAALKAVNKELITLYWDIGKMIVERQKSEAWGRSVVESLSLDLQREFPGVRGLSSRNIWGMRDLYLVYCKLPKLTPMVSEIGWTQNAVILEKCKTEPEREFYLRMSWKLGWSKSDLINQIRQRTFEKTINNQTNFERTLPSDIRLEAQLSIKDEYTFDFLELSDERNERKLEAAILSKIEPFLNEMGGVFAFLGSQYRIEISEREFFIDLLLYHRVLKALVAIEIKTGEFQPEFVGKMQFYLAVLDKTLRLPGESPPIGMILCKNKDKTIVEYALFDSNKPIGVASYQIVKTLPPELQTHLPHPDQIARFLEGIGRLDS